MAQAARYLFDLDFSAPAEPEPIEEPIVEEVPPEPMITVAEHEALLEQVRQQAYDQGLQIGKQEAMDSREQLASETAAQTQQKILDEIGMVYTEVGILLQRLEKDASKLAFAFASRFAEKLVAQEPKEEIMALLHQVLAPLRGTPHISIRLNEEIAEEIEQKAQEQMQELGFAGTLKIIADPAIMAGDCEVEWADGGIGRNLRSAIRQAEDLLEQHFAHIPDAPEDERDDAEAQDENTTEDTAPTSQDETTQDEAPQAPEASADPVTDTAEMPASDCPQPLEEMPSPQTASPSLSSEHAQPETEQPSALGEQP